MAFSFRRRQLLTAALVANAIRPLRAYPLSVPTMIGGWLVSELAPYILAGSATDSVRELTRESRDRKALALAGVSAVGLGYLIRQSLESGRIVESALGDALGPDYRPHEGGVGVLVSPVTRVPDNVSVTRDLRYTEGKRGLLDIYRPRTPRPGGSPVVIHVHGGAWMSGDKSYEGLPLLHHLAARGWLCINVNYRFSPAHPFPAQIIDVKRAIAWVREHGAEFDADTSFVAITGGSAGGHLAALAALTGSESPHQPGFEDADTTIQAAAPRYGIYDFTGDSGTDRAIKRRDRFLAPLVMKKQLSGNESEFRAASPLHQITAEAPPFFVVHGLNDTGVEVDESRHFVSRLREVSRQPVAYAELPGAQHAFDIFASIRSRYLVHSTERFLEWAFDRHVNQHRS